MWGWHRVAYRTGYSTVCVCMCLLRLVLHNQPCTHTERHAQTDAYVCVPDVGYLSYTMTFFNVSEFYCCNLGHCCWQLTSFFLQLTERHGCPSLLLSLPLFSGAAAVAAAVSLFLLSTISISVAASTFCCCCFFFFLFFFFLHVRNCCCCCCCFCCFVSKCWQLFCHFCRNWKKIYSNSVHKTVANISIHCVYTISTYYPCI